jgi:hypothetical protein
MHSYTHTYRLKLQPFRWSPTALTPDVLVERLADDAALRSLTEDLVVDIGLERESHPDALNELLLAVQSIGYTFVEGEITKVADRALEMAVGGGATGLGIVGSASQNGEAALIAGTAGWLLGLFVGANMEKVEVIYQVQQTYAGWRLVPTPRTATAAGPALETA